MKRILLVISFIFTVFLLAACDKTSKELKTVSMFGGTDPNATTYQGLIEEFEEESGWTVKDNSATSSEEWKSSVIALFQSGDEPDVLHFFNGATAVPITSTNKVVSIADIRKEKSDYATNISESVLDEYAVPTTGFVEGIFVNKDFFNTDDLEAYLDKDNWTWNDLLDICNKLVDANTDVEGFHPIAYSSAEPHYWIEHVLLASLGEEFAVNMPESSVVNNTHSWVKALGLLNEIEPYMSQEETADAMKANFYAEGKSAMYLDGSWFAGNIKEDSAANLDNVVMFPFPSIPTAKGGTGKVYLQSGFTSGFYITKKAWDNKDKREQAIAFIEKMTSTESLAKFAENGGIPADSSVVIAGQTNLQKQLNTLPSRTDANALPLSDAGKAGSFATLVTAADSFINNNVADVVKAVKDYLDLQ